MSVAALVPAAGRGERMGGAGPKALLLLREEPLLVHAVRGLRACPEVGPIVVAAPPDRVEEVRALLASYDVTVVAGGETRGRSVRHALAATPPDADLVLVHDAARALAPSDVLSRVVEALRDGADAVVPVLPIGDTVKEVDGELVTATLDRSRLRSVQTPQGFRRSVLDDAYREADDDGATDDAALVEARGGSVRTVPGAPEAFKVTHPFDLLVAEAVLHARG